MNDTTVLLPHIKLRFNIENPNFEECYAYGYECALAEINESENPYRLGSKESEEWLEGWWAGFYGEKSMYEVDDNDPHHANEGTVEAANDLVYSESTGGFFAIVMELSGMFAVSAVVGYQVLDLLVA